MCDQGGRALSDASSSSSFYSFCLFDTINHTTNNYFCLSLTHVHYIYILEERMVSVAL